MLINLQSDKVNWLKLYLISPAFPGPCLVNNVAEHPPYSLFSARSCVTIFWLPWAIVHAVTLILQDGTEIPRGLEQHDVTNFFWEITTWYTSSRNVWYLLVQEVLISVNYISYHAAQRTACTMVRTSYAFSSRKHGWTFVWCIVLSKCNDHQLDRPLFAMVAPK